MSSNPITAKPYLSVVATARNDNHGGNLIQRMQLFVSGLIEQCNRHGVETELILVEWNPPPDKPRLAEVLNWPASCGKCTVRIIEVPPEVHHRLNHADRLPLFQMIGKNVGIRRARGEFVLATNIDILFSDAVFEFLKSGQMKPGFIYRTNRFDVPAEVPHDKCLDEQLRYCRQRVMRRHFFEGSYDRRLRRWVSRRGDVTKNFRGRCFALRWKMVVTWRALRNTAINYSRHYRNRVLNRCRWLFDRFRDRVRWSLHRFRNFLRKAVRMAFRFLVVCARPLWNKIGNNYRLTYTRCAVRVLGEHLRSSARVRCRYTAMCVRDALPKWLDQGRLFPARVNVDSRNERKRALRDYIDVLRSVDLRVRIGRATVRQLRERRLKQIEMDLERIRLLAECVETKKRQTLERQTERERVKKKKQRLKQEQLRRIKAERLERKRRRKFEARRQQALERRQRRLAEDMKRKGQQKPGQRRLADRQKVAPKQTAAVPGDAWNRRDGSDESRNGLQPENGQPLRETRLVVQELPSEARSELEHGTGGAAKSDKTCVPVMPEMRGNGEHGAEHTNSASVESDARRVERQAPQPRRSLIASFSRRTTSWFKYRTPKVPLQWPNMHTNGCGDFTMLAKEDWDALRGYPEFQMYSMHIDSLFMLAAGHHGLKQQLLHDDAIIYHIEHGIGSGWTPEGHDKLNQRLAEAGIPQISHDECTAYDVSMATTGRAEMFNDENWGFDDLCLPETTVYERPHL
ncbi:MAG: hypothetical protein WD648_11900 [Planctomycetaceae bacterium]